MKILVINHSYPNKFYPNAFIFVHNQAKMLRKAGHDVVVLDVDIRSIRWRRRYGNFQELYEGIPIYRFSIPYISKLLPKTVVPLSHFLGNILYKQAVKEHGKFDISHCHFAQAGSVGVLLKEKYSLPMVYTEHSSSVYRGKKSVIAMSLPSYFRADQVIAVGEALKAKLQLLGSFNIAVVPNVINTDLFKILDVKRREKFSFIFVGDLILRKRCHILIEAFLKLNQKYQNIELLIIGSGKEASRLIEQAKGNNNIKFWGRIENKELPALYNSCHCFVLPSSAETFGVVYAEALACGIPAIATDCGGPLDIVGDNNGIIVPVDDLEALYTAMNYMYIHAADYDRNKLHLEIKSKFSESVILMQLEKIYSETITKEAIV